MTKSPLARIVAALCCLVASARADFTGSFASIGYGEGLDNGNLIPGIGGQKGNFVDLFSRSPTGMAMAPFYNPSVGGYGTANALANYDLTVSGRPIVHAPGYFATGFDLLYNDGTFLHVPTSQTIANLNALAAKARASGYSMVLVLTCPFRSTAQDNANIDAANAAIMAGGVTGALVLDMRGIFAPGAQNDPTLFQPDHIHPLLSGQAIIEAALENLLKLTAPAVTPNVVSVDDGKGGTAQFLEGVFTQPGNRPDIVFTVETSGDLVAWASGPGVTQEMSRVTNADGTQTVRVRDLTPGKARFLRVRASFP